MRTDLDAAVELGRIVQRAGGSAAPDIVAAALGYSGTNNGTFLTRLANARLFGVVGGRGRIDLTARGRAILEGSPAEAAAARRAAVLAVPLIRAVVDHLAGQGRRVPPEPALAALLAARFGEPPERAAPVAAKLAASLAQGGLTVVRGGEMYLVEGPLTDFTVVDTVPSPAVVPGVGWRVTRLVGRRAGRRPGSSERGRP